MYPNLNNKQGGMRRRNLENEAVTIRERVDGLNSISGSNNKIIYNEGKYHKNKYDNEEHLRQTTYQNKNCKYIYLKKN